MQSALCSLYLTHSLLRSSEQDQIQVFISTVDKRSVEHVELDYMTVFETSAPERNQRWPKGNMYALQRKSLPSQESNPGPCCEVTLLTTTSPPQFQIIVIPVIND